jgi:hypothetical protein
VLGGMTQQHHYLVIGGHKLLFLHCQVSTCATKVVCVTMTPWILIARPWCVLIVPAGAGGCCSCSGAGPATLQCSDAGRHGGAVPLQSVHLNADLNATAAGTPGTLCLDITELLAPLGSQRYGGVSEQWRGGGRRRHRGGRSSYD